MPLPTNLDVTYADDANDPSVKEHQQAHDKLHGRYNEIFNIKEYGAVGDGIADDTAEIQAAIDAANTAGGGIVYLPAGNYKVSAPLVLPRHVHLIGAEHATRYWTYSSTAPTHLTMITVAAGFVGTAVIMPRSTAQTNAAYGYSIQNLTIYGARVGTVNGIHFPLDTTNQNAKVHNVAITSMGGSGMTGEAMVLDLSHFFIGGCLGWGINATEKWTDTHMVNGFISGNVLGGVNFDTAANSGYVMFTNVRIERSGWDSAAPTAPVGTSSPGIRLRTANNFAFVNCTTDANSGHGVDIEPSVNNSSLFGIQFTNCIFRRDGFGDMAVQGDFAAVRLNGVGGRVPTYIAFHNCVAQIGKAVDGGANPAYNHPKYGLWWSIGSHNEWVGGRVEGAVQGLNLAGSYRPLLYIPNSGVFAVPPGPTSSRPANPLQGFHYYDSTLGKPIWYTGSAWVDATGTTV